VRAAFIEPERPKVVVVCRHTTRQDLCNDTRSAARRCRSGDSGGRWPVLTRRPRRTRIGPRALLHDPQLRLGANRRPATARRSARARISSSWSTRLSIRPYSSTQRIRPIQGAKPTSFWGRACSAPAPMRQASVWSLFEALSHRPENMAVRVNLSEYHTVTAPSARGAGGREPADEFG